jgi:hypothetical protein
MRHSITILTLAMATFSLSSCSMYGRDGNPEPGQYNQSSRSVDAHGTARTTQKSTNVYYDEYGHKKIDVDKRTTTDPKGLMNKTTTRSHQNME